MLHCERHGSTLMAVSNRLTCSHQTGSQRRTSDWKRSWTGIWNQCRALCIHCLTLSGKRVGLVFSINNYQESKRSFSTEGQDSEMWEVSCGAHPFWQTKWNRKGKTDIARLSQTDETAQWWQAVRSCSDMLSQYTVWQKQFNFLSAMCTSTTTDGFHKGNIPMESDKPADKMAICLWAIQSTLIPMLEKPSQTLPLWFIAWFVTWMQLAYFHSY